MFYNKKTLSLSFLASSLLVVLAFQNCSPNAFTNIDSSSLSSLGTSNSGDSGGTRGDGTQGFSEKCDDYAAIGFASKDDCLKDGSWHLVVETPQGGGSPIVGSVDELQRHVDAGTDVKVIVPEQRLYSGGSALSITYSGNEECQQVYRSQSGNRPIYCLTSARFTGENNGETSSGSARFGTDGSLYCNSMRTRGNGCTVDPLTYKWYIRY